MVRKTYGLICLLFVIVSFVANAQVVVSTGGPPTNYATLTAAFTAINNGTHTGSISITLTASHTLTASATLNASGTGSASYTSISISPNTNVTITSSLTGTWSIYLNGADNIVIDGINNSGKSLTISNTSNSCLGTFVFYNSASNNTIKNCTILSAASSWGTITIRGTSSNNDNISITDNNIGGTAANINNGQCRAIFAEDGVVTDCSNNITIARNNIYNFVRLTAARGIQVGNGHNNWTISNNNLFNTYNLSGADATVYHYPILVYRTNASGRMNILNNIIGYNSASQTGTYSVNTTANIAFYGIYFRSPTYDTANIQGNIIRNISFGSGLLGTKFYGISIEGGVVCYLGNEIGNQIGDSSSTSSILVNHTSGTSSAAGETTYGIQIVSSNIYANVQNNVISGFLLTANTNSFGLGFRGISITGTAIDSICNNKIGSINTSNSIQLGASVSTANHWVNGIYFASSNSSFTYIDRNVVSNIHCNGSGTSTSYSYISGIFQYSTNPCSISENIVSNLSTYSGANSTTIYQSITGILGYSTTSGGYFNKNIIQNLYNLNSTASGRYISAMLQYYSTNVSIERNTIKDIAILGTATGTTAYGISTFGTSNIINNFIHINNNHTQNILGIAMQAGSNNSCNYNTVLIEGTNTLTGSTACFYRNNLSMSVQNNIFFNKRTSSGANYSLYNNTSIFTGATINYNLHVVPNTSTAIYHNGAARTWLNYYSVQNTSDRFSWCENTTNLAATSLFTNTTTSDLTINSGNSACWYVNGKGWPISGIQYDWEGDIGDERSQAVNGGGTDIGADEFNTSTTPPAATASAAPAAGTTTTYTFAGKTIATIAWTGGSNVPASVSVWYYSGNNPPVPIPGKNAFNCYWRIEPSTTPSGMSYRPTLYFSDALLGAVPSTTDLRMAKNSGLTPNINNWSCACSGTTVNATTRTFVPTTPYTSFSIFTGTDINAPLPVELLSFTATKQNKDILLQWQTTSEKNTERFEIERSYNGVDFEYTGKTVSAANMSNTLRNYNAIDREYAHTAAVVYYRLKIVDHDGFFEYSNIAVVTNNTVKQTTAVIHPNPFGNSTTLTLQNATSGSIEITIMDLAGNQLYAQTHDLKNPEEEIKIDTGFLKSGTYMLRVITAQESVIKKIVRY